MSVRPIALLGHPVLLERAAAVDEVGDPRIQALVDDMLETMVAADGIGLAAPQVHEGRRIIVAMEIDDRAGRGAAAARVMINPELFLLGDATAEAFEGCLSIPDLRGMVPRFERVAYRAVDRNGAVIEGEAKGLFARVLQHEVDHLDGILYLARMRDLRQLAFVSELPRLTAWLQPPET
jgi:peptide deformylase